ncbi:hypothetical protein [Desulfurobacterium sp. TC5-1]|uniref:hypothetical protein n=1 Tax=Desulfurobacterium sp. TC5-1 TaxID=1158318 RepID=UPI0003B65916|nr:hypothetical protein [Desulfurobacterium sp. TC5-1]
MVELDEKTIKIADKIKGKKFFRKILQKISRKRLIFTVTTGRSGTAYLSNLLASFDTVASFHEPDPNFAIVMRDVQKFPHLAIRFLFEKKLPVIASIDKPIYCETSHLFCKGFFFPLLELGVLPEIIVLKRNRRAVAKSLFELNTIPGRTSVALMFYLKPDDRVYLPVNNWQKLHDYQLCYWYCLEIEKRMEIYSKEIKNRGGRVYEVNLENLLDIKDVVKFFESLNLTISEKSLASLKSRVGTPVNTKKNIKIRSLWQELNEQAVLEMEKEIEEIAYQGGSYE